MRNLLNKGLIIISALLCFYLFTGASSESGKKQGKSSFNKANEGGEFFIFDINNLYMPLDNKGVIADVDPGDGRGPGGIFPNDNNNNIFLFSSGFYMSGINDGKVWSNGVLSASRIEDYQPGPAGASQYDPKNKVYVVSARDEAFGESWQEWIDAVSIGADFYDGDGDGIYNPIDKNGNGKWDTNEDKPDILGDKTAWCVYNDGVPSALRRYATIKPLGIEIHQTVFGFESAGIVGNLLFVRYRIVNTGSVYDKLEDVYFSAAADPDLGTPDDDLVGCDIDLSAGFVYNNGPDETYGNAPPSFLLDFFLGPVVYEPGVTFQDVNGNGEYDEESDIALDTAFVVKGPTMGKDILPGARNLPLTSMTQYMQSHPTHGDPDNQFEVRNYLLGGKGKEGDSVHVSTWTFGNGEALGADTANIEARFMYSGEPEAGTGWLNIEPIDQRIMCNTGPFEINSGEHQDIFVAYVVGQGTSALNSVTVAKQNDKTAQLIFDNNFPTVAPPPVPSYQVFQGQGYMDIVIEPAVNFNYRGIDTVFQVDRRVEGFYINAFKYPQTDETILGEINRTTLLHYDVDNWIKNIYVEADNGNKYLVKDTGTASLDPVLYSDPSFSRFKFRISEDPFTREPLIFGKDYYFNIGTYTLNYEAIVNKETGNFGDPGDVIYPEKSTAYEDWPQKLITIKYGSNDYNPETGEVDAELTSGSSDGEVKFLIVESDSLTGDTYQVEFFRDSSNKYYDMFWRLVNETKNQVLIDSSKDYNFDLNDISGALTDGFKVRVKEAAPKLINLTTQQQKFESAEKWYTDFNRNENTGIYYVGKDIKPSDDANFDPIYNPLFKSADARGISVGQIKRVELRFGETSKAYRYLNGFYGSNPLRKTKSYVYAEAVTDQDTIDHGPVGNWDSSNNHAVGRVDVPFAAYVVDYKLGTDGEPFEQRLNVAIIEKSSKESSIYPKPGTPDGVWDPGTSIDRSQELIAILNSEYSESNDPIYVGGFVDSEGETVWADIIQGYDIPENANVSKEQRNIAKYPFFDALYTVNLQRLVDKNEPNASFYTAGDKLVMEVESYPYTESDTYTYESVEGGAVSEEYQNSVFEKVNVYPNPLYGYNARADLYGQAPDDPFVTFSHLPDDASVRIYSLSGALLRTLNIQEDGNSTSSMNWDLKNESELRVASGMYLAIVESPKYGQKILKFALILPQKQLPRY